MRILVVEDEVDLNKIIQKRLKIEGYSVDSCHHGEEALEYLTVIEYDAVIMDVMMPKLDGFQTLKQMREKKIATPVLLLTAKDEIENRVKGLDLGADDYLVKPFSFEELMARLRAMTRRKHGNTTSKLQVANLILDGNTHEVKRGEQPIELSAKEFAILEYMMQNEGIVLSRERLEEHIWDYEYQGASNMVDVYIRYLRKKMDNEYEPKLIHTIRGVGYVLKEKEPKE